MKPNGEINFDAIWTALSRSTKLRSYIEDLAKQVEAQATSLAQAEAYDEGYYADLFTSQVASAAEVRRAFTDTYEKRRNRRRRSGTNRLIDTKGDPDGASYGGSVGIVANTDFKAVWVEYGSIAKGPRLILNRAGEATAAQAGMEWEQLYAKTHEQNLSVLQAKISAGMTAKNNGGRYGGKA
jgi:hypothetical protein